MKKWLSHYWIWLVALGGMAVVVVLYAARPTNNIPADIRQQANMIIIYPGPASGYVVKKTDVHFNVKAKILTIEAIHDQNRLVITEQVAPDQINDIPQYLPKLAELLHSYKSFDSLDGKVFLTRPTELKGAQSAMFVGKGTLVFVHPNHDLSDDEWRSFFNEAILVR